MASHALNNACTPGHKAVGRERGDLGVSQLTGAAEKHDGTCFGVHGVLTLDAPIIGCFYRCPESGPLILVSTPAHVCVALARAFPRAHAHAHGMCAHAGTQVRTCRHSSPPWGVGNSLAPHVSLDLTSNAHVQRPPSTLSPDARTREAGMGTLPAWLSICACAMQLRACPCLHTSTQPIAQSANLANRHGTPIAKKPREPPRFQAPSSIARGCTAPASVVVERCSFSLSSRYHLLRATPTTRSHEARQSEQKTSATERAEHKRDGARTPACRTPTTSTRAPHTTCSHVQPLHRQRAQGQPPLKARQPSSVHLHEEIGGKAAARTLLHFTRPPKCAHGVGRAPLFASYAIQLSSRENSMHQARQPPRAPRLLVFLVFSPTPRTTPTS
jgi:hypothetical protein